MTSSNWLGLLGDGLRQGRRRALLSGLGLMAGVAALAYFMALGKGVREVLIGRLIRDLPAEEVQVLKPSMTVGPLQMERPRLLGGGKTLNDDLVEQLKNLSLYIDGKKTEVVKKVWRQLDADFPASITGHLFGVSYGTDTAISGIDPEMASADVQVGAFTYSPDAQEVPALVPRALLEVYNSAFARAQELPQLSPSFLMGKHFDMHLGRSSVSRIRAGGTIRTRGVIVGLTDRGTLLGVTVPIEYVKEWNKSIGKSAEPPGYRMLTLVARDPKYVPDILEAVRDMGFEVRASTGLAERVGSIIAMVTAGLSLVAGVILFVATLNALSLFRLSAFERQQEVGLLMALGATRKEVRSLVLAEAASVGFIGGCAGILLGMMAGWSTDALMRALTEIPLMPDRLIMFSTSIIAPGIGLAIVLALSAAWPTARQLSRLNPAEILS